MGYIPEEVYIELGKILILISHAGSLNLVMPTSQSFSGRKSWLKNWIWFVSQILVISSKALYRGWLEAAAVTKESISSHQ